MPRISRSRRSLSPNDPTGPNLQTIAELPDCGIAEWKQPSGFNSAVRQFRSPAMISVDVCRQWRQTPLQPEIAAILGLTPWGVKEKTPEGQHLRALKPCSLRRYPELRPPLP